MTDALIHPPAPQVEAAALQGASHQGYHIFFGQSELKLYSFKRGSVLPGHLNNAVNFCRGAWYCFFHLLHKTGLLSGSLHCRSPVHCTIGVPGPDRLFTGIPISNNFRQKKFGSYYKAVMVLLPHKCVDRRIRRAREGKKAIRFQEALRRRSLI